MKGWSKFKEEFSEVFRGLTQLGYAVFFIGHGKEAKDNEGNITNIRPALSTSTREVISGMADIFGYAMQMGKDENSMLVLRDKTGFIECGCRFKNVQDIIPMNYNALVDEISRAIDTEAAEYGNQYVTDEKNKEIEVRTYDYDALMAEFQSLVGPLMQGPEATTNGQKITSIIDKYLGKGKKIADTTREQAEFIYLIVTEIKEDILQK